MNELCTKKRQKDEEVKVEKKETEPNPEFETPRPSMVEPKHEKVEVPNKVQMKQPNRPPPLKQPSGEDSSEYGDEYGSEESEDCSSDGD